MKIPSADIRHAFHECHDAVIARADHPGRSARLPEPISIESRTVRRIRGGAAPRNAMIVAAQRNP
jgi:hypothetical protein